MPNSIVTVTTAETHHALNVDADPTNLAPLQTAALNRLRAWYPHHGVSAVKAEIAAGGKAVKFTITSTLGDASAFKPALR